MKRTNYILVICALIVAFLLGCFITATIIDYRNDNRCYAKTARIVELDRENDVVVIEDNNGFLWEFTGCEDWEIGDSCACVMNSKGTETIFDDEIVKVIYEA